MRRCPGRAPQVLKGHSAGVVALTVIDIDKVVSGSSDSTMCVWNIATGERERVLVSPPQARAAPLAAARRWQTLSRSGGPDCAPCCGRLEPRGASHRWGGCGAWGGSRLPVPLGQKSRGD